MSDEEEFQKEASKSKPSQRRTSSDYSSSSGSDAEPPPAHPSFQRNVQDVGRHSYSSSMSGTSENEGREVVRRPPTLNKSAAKRVASDSSSDEGESSPRLPQRNDPHRSTLARGSSADLGSSTDEEIVNIGATGGRDPNPHEIGKLLL